MCAGYAKITRKGNDCGITADPVMAVVDEEAALLFKQRLAAKQQVVAAGEAAEHGSGDQAGRMALKLGQEEAGGAREVQE